MLSLHYPNCFQKLVADAVVHDALAAFKKL
jgi:hypothetical protein